MAFLTLLDERARPKGSRDPLGFEMVWTYFGRKVVGNLTTITSSWRNFAVGLLGFYWVRQLCRDAHPVERQRLLQEHFIRYEQLAAYLRALAGEQEIMGITRVGRRLGEGGRNIRLGTDQECQILSDQVSYGIWGLYSTALRETGLLRGEERELTPAGLALAERIEAGLDRNWYWTYLRGDRRAVPRAELEGESRRFRKAVTGKRVKSDLVAALLRGSGNHQCQLALYNTVRRLDPAVLVSGNLDDLIATISAATDVDELRLALADIAAIERLLVAANRLFSYCRLRDDEPLERVAARVAQHCDFRHLPAGPMLAGCPYAPDLDQLRSLLRANDISAALRCLLAINRKIMAGRGGAAWVEEGVGGRLRVRVPAETAALPGPDELQRDWDYDYFLRAYARIAAGEAR